MKTKLLITSCLSIPLLLLGPGCVSSTPIKQVAAANPIQVQSQQKKRPIQFRKIVIKVKRGEEIGTIHGGMLNIAQGKLYWRKGGYLNFSDEDFSQRFREELESANYEVVGNPDSLFDEPSEWKAELLIAGLVKELKLNSYFPLSGLGDYSTSRGTAYLKVEWQVFSRLDRKVVLTLSTEGSIEQKKALRDGLDDALADAFSVAVKNLLGEKSFFDLVVSSSEPKLEGAGVSVRLVEGSAATPASEKMPDIQTAVVTLLAGDAMGSGFIISEDGYILSNQHVVGDARYVRIKFSTGLEANGEVISRHRARDVALIKCGQQGLRGLPIRHDLPKVGEDVYAIGTPMEQRLNQTVTKGIVSGYRSIEGANYIQSDVAINPGNSGGPLIDKNGFVVGISVLKRTDAASLGFFVPIDETLRALQINGGERRTEQAAQTP